MYYSPLDEMLVNHGVTPVGTHLYTWVERQCGVMSLVRLRKQHNYRAQALIH